MNIITEQSTHITNQLDSNAKKVLANCIYSIAKLKETLHLENDSHLEKILSRFGLEKMISNLEIWPILLFLSTAVFCLGCSTIFHWFHQKNKTISNILNKLDQAGISILIYGSTVSLLYYLSYCKKMFFLIYFIIFTVSSSTIFCLSMMDWFYSNENKALRTYILIGLGLVSGGAMFHTIINQYSNTYIVSCIKIATKCRYLTQVYWSF